MSKPTEALVFVYRVVPTWGDLDSARIVYTASYTDYAMRAIVAWFLERVGADFYAKNFDGGIGTPFVHNSCDIKSSLTPRDRLPDARRRARRHFASLNPASRTCRRGAEFSSATGRCSGARTLPPPRSAWDQPIRDRRHL